jgi:NADH-quinone oxidoreductase subunit C
MNSSTGHTSPGGLARVLLRTRVPNGQSPTSATGLWSGAAWHERETHEMFGIDFDGFDDRTGRGLRPLLLPDGFEGTPLRKSFVLAARASKAWPGAKEPGEGSEGGPAVAHEKPGRKKIQAPGVPDTTWGPR